MSNIKLNVAPVGAEIVKQLKKLVPVRTGRLRNGISYEVHEQKDGYVVYIKMEDYFAWLKPRTKAPTLPSPRELALSKPPLPKMNNLGLVKQSELTPRSRSIMSKIDMKKALRQMALKELIEDIKSILRI